MNEGDGPSSACGMNTACYKKARKLAVLLECFILIVHRRGCFGFLGSLMNIYSHNQGSHFRTKDWFTGF